MQVALDAKVRVEAMPPADANGGDVQATAAAHDRALRRLAAWRQKRDADDLQQKIAGNDLVLGILAPDGLRAKKLAHAMSNRLTTPPNGGAMRQKAEPWLALGISRATWYRLGKPETKPVKPPRVTQKQAAELMQVSVRRIQRVARISRIAPDLMEQCKAGKLSTAAAEHIARMRELATIFAFLECAELDERDDC
jgi:hypothetical protein